MSSTTKHFEDVLDRMGYSTGILLLLSVDLLILGMMGFGAYQLHDAYIDLPAERREAFQRIIVNVGTKGLAFAVVVRGVMWLF